MIIDKRVRAKEFMDLLAVGRTNFYRLLKKGHTLEPIRVTEKKFSGMSQW